MKCKNCGTDIDDNAVFCQECRGKVEKTVPCSKCGAIIPVNAKFCTQCGTKVLDVSDTATVVTSEYNYGLPENSNNSNKKTSTKSTKGQVPSLNKQSTSKKRTKTIKSPIKLDHIDYTKFEIKAEQFNQSVLKNGKRMIVFVVGAAVLLISLGFINSVFETPSPNNENTNNSASKNNEFRVVSPSPTLEIPQMPSPSPTIINPSVDYIVNALKRIPTILETEIETENTAIVYEEVNDKIVAKVFFSSSLVEQEQFKGESVSESGTKRGGSIDIFATEELALLRDDYLAKFDDTLLEVASHKVIGSIVIRVSSEMNEENRKILENAIICSLTNQPIPDDIYQISSSTPIPTPRPTSTPTPIPTPTPKPTPTPTPTSSPIPQKIKSEYEKAYIRDMSNYDLYYMFDTDTNSVVYFGTNDTYVEKGIYTGNFSTGVTITWSHGEWTETFIHKNGVTATLIDGNGWDWDYKVCDVEKAQAILNGL